MVLCVFIFYSTDYTVELFLLRESQSSVMHIGIKASLGRRWSISKMNKLFYYLRYTASIIHGFLCICWDLLSYSSYQWQGSLYNDGAWWEAGMGGNEGYIIQIVSSLFNSVDFRSIKVFKNTSNGIL